MLHLSIFYTYLCGSKMFRRYISKYHHNDIGNICGVNKMVTYNELFCKATYFSIIDSKLHQWQCSTSWEFRSTRQGGGLPQQQLGNSV